QGIPVRALHRLEAVEGVHAVDFPVIHLADLGVAQNIAVGVVLQIVCQPVPLQLADQTAFQQRGVGEPREEDHQAQPSGLTIADVIDALQHPPGNAQVGRYLYRVIQQRSEEHTSELQSRENLVCRLLLEKKNS